MHRGRKLQRLVKQRRESAEIYKAQGRPDLAEPEIFQASIIEKYLPDQMSEDDLLAIVQKVITDTGASSSKDMGKVMGMASKLVAGKADNKMISEIIKKLLP